ncbi:MAG: hypothetical protein AAGK97_15520 [Bacteroidota bacterium]
MKQLQFYKYATIALLLLNLAMIAFFFLTKPKPIKKEITFNGPHELLSLDEEQEKAFLNLAKDHKAELKNINKNQQRLLSEYFKKLNNNNVQTDSLMDQVIALEKNKIESTYQHFTDIKQILNPNQLDQYDKFVEAALSRILKTSSRTPPPRGGNRNKKR